MKRYAVIAGMMFWLSGGTGCAARRAEAEPALVRMEWSGSGDGYLLTLVPAPGARINARLRPVLELEGGTKIQFDQALLTPDSGYFAAPPVAMVDQGVGRFKGVLKLGVCPPGLNLCRPLQIQIDTVLKGGK